MIFSRHVRLTPCCQIARPRPGLLIGGERWWRKTAQQGHLLTPCPSPLTSPFSHLFTHPISPLHLLHFAAFLPFSSGVFLPSNQRSFLKINSMLVCSIFCNPRSPLVLSPPLKPFKTGHSTTNRGLAVRPDTFVYTQADYESMEGHNGGQIRD